MVDVEGIAQWMAGDDARTKQIHARHFSDVEILSVPCLPTGDGAAVRRGRRRFVYTLHHLFGARLRWAVLHEFSEMRLEELGVVGNVEELAERITAAVVMPRAAFIREAMSSRMCLSALARRFKTTQTAAALRLAEAAVVQAAAVEHPKFRLVRGGYDPLRVGLETPITDAPHRLARFVA